MKKQLFTAIAAICLMLGATNIYAQSGAHVEGKKGGSAHAGDKKVEVKGKSGGGVKIDKSGMSVKSKHGNGLDIKKKKK